jgi:hypothetical protein
VRSWLPDAGVKPAEDESAGEGGKKARFTQESTKETVKTIARGKPDRSGWTCGDDLAFFYAKPRVQHASGFPCALRFLFEGRCSASLGRNRAAGMLFHVFIIRQQGKRSRQHSCLAASRRITLRSCCCVNQMRPYLLILTSRASGVSKDEASFRASWFEMALTRLLTMRG